MDLFAYVDAGAASILLQACMAGFAGFVVFLRYCWQRFSRSTPHEKSRVRGMSPSTATLSNLSASVDRHG